MKLFSKGNWVISILLISFALLIITSVISLLLNGSIDAILVIGLGLLTLLVIGIIALINAKKFFATLNDLFTKLLDMHSDVLDCPSRKDRNDKFTQFIYLEKEDILNDYPTKIPDLRVKSDILREFKARKARKRREKANFVSNAEKTKMHNAWIITQFAVIAFHFLTMWSFGSEVPLLLVGTAGICLLVGIVIGFKQAGLGGAIGGYFGGGILGGIAGGILFGVSGLIYTLLFNLFDIDTFLTVVPMTGFLVYAFGFVFHIIRGIVKKQRITFGFIFWNLVMIGACVYVSSLLSNLIFEKLPYIAMGFEGFFM